MSPNQPSLEERTGGRAEPVLFFGFLVLAAAVPLADWPSFVDSILIKNVFIFAIIGALLTSWLFLNRDKRLFVGGPFRSILILLLLIFVSTINSIHIPTSLFGQYRDWGGAIAYLVLAFSYFLAIQVSWDADRVKMLMRVMVYTAGLVAAGEVSRFGYAVSTGAPKVPQVTASFVGPNVFSFYLMSVWPLVLRLLLSTETRIKEKAALAVTCLFIFTANIITFSRTGLILSLLLLFAVVLMSGDKKKLLPFGAVAAVLLFAITVSTSNQWARANLGQRAASIFTADALAVRIELWKSAVKLIRLRPLSGYGPNTYRLAFPKVESFGQAQMKRKLRTPHNYPLNLAVGSGIPALLVTAFIFASAIFKSFSGRDYWRQTLGLSLVGALVCTLVFEWPVFLMFLFWLFMGIIWADAGTRKNFSPAFKPVLFMLAALVIAWAGSLAAADYYFQQARRMPSSSTKIAYLSRAVRLNRYAYIYWKEYFESTEGQPLAERLKIIRLARRLHPLQEETWIIEAGLNRKQKAGPKKVIALLNRALKIRPYSGRAHYLKGRVLRSNKRFKEAAVELDLAIKLLPQHPKYVGSALRAKKVLTNPAAGRVRALREPDD